MHQSGRVRADHVGGARGVIGSRPCRGDSLLLSVGAYSQERCSPPAIGTGPLTPGGLGDALPSADQLRGRLDRSMSEPASRYKTELCRPFEESGHCKYGDKCQFAHGGRELRTLSRHPKYKTELCRTFHTIGFCPYGPRCHFIHNEDERRLSQIFQMRQAAGGGSPPPQPIAPRCPQVASHPSVVHRPKALSFGGADFLSRDTLGSTADSPPSSVTDSPTRSPTFLADEPLFAADSLLSGRMFAPILAASQPIGMSSSQSAFPFHAAGRHMSPLNVQTGDAIASLAASLQATSLTTDDATFNAEIVRECLYRMRLGGGPNPPSPPESLSDVDSGVSTCGSPLEVSRGLHLGGIFAATTRLLED